MTPLHLLAAFWLAALAPASDDAMAQCLAQCDDASATDRESCRLQCDEAARSRTAPNVVRWKRTEELGGAPPGAKDKGGTTTTTTTETPSGTTTRTETTKRSSADVRDGASTAELSRPAHDPPSAYAAMARCQITCSATSTTDAARASCKLGCLERFPSPPRRPVFVAKPRTALRASSR